MQNWEHAAGIKLPLFLSAFFCFLVLGCEAREIRLEKSSDKPVTSVRSATPDKDSSRLLERVLKQVPQQVRRLEALWVTNGPTLRHPEWPELESVSLANGKAAYAVNGNKSLTVEVTISVLGSPSLAKEALEKALNLRPAAPQKRQFFKGGLFYEYPYGPPHVMCQSGIYDIEVIGPGNVREASDERLVIEVVDGIVLGLDK